MSGYGTRASTVSTERTPDSTEAVRARPTNSRTIVGASGDGYEVFGQREAVLGVRNTEVQATSDGDEREVGRPSANGASAALHVPDAVARSSLRSGPWRARSASACLPQRRWSGVACGLMFKRG